MYTYMYKKIYIHMNVLCIHINICIYIGNIDDNWLILSIFGHINTRLSGSAMTNGNAQGMSYIHIHIYISIHI
jgi:hypothetical protein